MAYFAKINKDNIVEQVIVADQDFINSGKVGDPKQWIETFIDGKEKKNYAGIGYSIDKERDAFIPKKELASFILDETTCRWKAPKIEPTLQVDEYCEWSETNKDWDIIKIPISVKEDLINIKS